VELPRTLLSPSNVACRLEDLSWTLNRES